MSKVLKVVAVVASVAATIGSMGAFGGVALAIVGGVAAVATIGAQLLQKRPKGSDERQAQEISLSLGEQPRTVLFGEAVTGGGLLDAFNYGGKYGTDWEMLVVALADHECESFDGLYVNNEFVAYTGDGDVAGYNGKLKLWWRPGTENQSLPGVVSLNGIGWTANDNLAGVSFAVVAYKSDQPDEENPTWPGGRPSFRYKLKGKKLYDPRKDSTVPGGSGLHRWSDPSTREWGNNAALCRYNFQRGIYALEKNTEPDQLLLGRGLSEIEAPPERAMVWANLCDEDVPLKAGGTEKRYTINGVIASDETFLQAEQKFAAAMGGIIVQPEGSIEVEPGHAKSVVAEFTDDDILNLEAVNVEKFRSESDPEWCNMVVPRYVEPSQNWKMHGGPIRRVYADVIEDGGIREKPLSHELITSATQSQRCAEIERRLGRLQKTGQLSLPPRFIHVEEGDWVGWTSQRHFGGSRFVFRVEKYNRNEKWHMALVLREINAGAFFYDPEVDELANGAEATNQVEPPAVGQPGTGAWTLTAGEVASPNGTQPALVITGVVDDDYASAVRFEYRKAIDADWIDAGSSARTATRKVMAPVSPNTEYVVGVTYTVDGEASARRVYGPVTSGNLGIDFGNVTGTEDLQSDIDSASLSIIPDKTGFTYSNGALSPASQTVTLTAQVKGVDTNVDWTTAPNIKSEVDSSTFSINNTEMAANQSVVVTATDSGGVKRAYTLTKQADSSATIGAPAGSPFSDRTVDDVEQDITDAKTDIDDLFTVFGDTDSAAASALAAEAAKNAAVDASGDAQTSSAIAASYASAVGLAPNGRFTQGKESWFAGFTDPPQNETNLDYETNYQGEAHALVNNTDNRKNVSGRTFPIDPSRKYRAKARVYSNGTGGTIYLGFQSMGPDGNTIGTNYGLSYAILANDPLPAGWHDVESNIITGESSNASLAFRVGAIGARMVGFLNYSATAGQEYGVAYLDMVDVTEVEDAKAQATIAEAHAVISTDKASQAASDQQLAADFAADSEASAVISEAERVIATDAASAAKTSEIVSAQFASQHIGPNADMTDWPSGQTNPSHWTTWSTAGGTMTRVAGAKANTFRPKFDVVGGNTGNLGLRTIVPDSIVGEISTGWHVFEVDIMLHSGVLDGIVFYIRTWNADRSSASTYWKALTDEPLVGETANAGSGTAGKMHRWRILHAVGDIDASRLEVYVIANGYDSRYGDKSVTVENWGVRPANPGEIATQTVLPQQAADITINQAAIADHESSAVFWELIAAATGSTPAIMRALAGKNGSELLWAGDRILIANPIGGELVEVARFEGGVARMNAALIRDLKVPPFPESEIFHPVLLKPLIFHAAHDDVVQYQGGDSYGVAPDNIEVDIAGASLPALAEGESYDIRATNITATSFKARAIKTTAAEAVTQESSAGTNVGGTPAWQTNKPTAANAKDDIYTYYFTATLTKIGSTQTTIINEGDPSTWKYTSEYGGEVTIYGKIGSTWTALWSGTVGRTYSTTGDGGAGHTATKSFGLSKSVSTSADLGSGSSRFGIHQGAGATITAFSSVKYSTQTIGTETAVGGLFKFTVHPPTPA